MHSITLCTILSAERERESKNTYGSEKVCGDANGYVELLTWSTLSFGLVAGILLADAQSLSAFSPCGFHIFSYFRRFRLSRTPYLFWVAFVVVYFRSVVPLQLVRLNLVAEVFQRQLSHGTLASLLLRCKEKLFVAQLTSHGRDSQKKLTACACVVHWSIFCMIKNISCLRKSSGKVSPAMKFFLYRFVSWSISLPTLHTKFWNYSFHFKLYSLG